MNLWVQVIEHSTSRSGIDSSVNNLDHSIEIEVEIPSVHGRRREKKKKEDIEMAFRRRINRDMKERQLLLHKASLLCLFGRSYKYNRILNDTLLMSAALKLLPGKESYPNEGGTEVKYFVSLVKWFKGTVKVADNVFYSTKRVRNKRKELLQQIQRKEALCNQDLVFILVILLRGMGIQCRLIVNLQPLPIRPPQSDLLVIKLKPDDGNNKETVPPKKSKSSELSDKSSKESTPMKSEKKIEQKLTAGVKSKSAEKDKSQDGKKLNEGNTMNNGDNNKKNNKSSTRTKAKETTNLKESKLNSKSDLEEIPVSTNLEVKRINRTRQKPSTIDDNINAKNTNPKILITKATEDKKKKELKTSSSRSKNKLPIKENELNKDADNVGVSEVIEGNNKKQSNSRTKPNIKKLSASNSVSKPISNNINELQDVNSGNAEAASMTASTSTLNSDTTKTKSKRPKISKLIVQTAGNAKSNKPDEKLKVPTKRVLRPRQNSNEATNTAEQKKKLAIPQLDGAQDFDSDEDKPLNHRKNKTAPKLQKLKSRSKEESDDDFKPSPPKKPKKAPILPKAVQNLRKDRRVLSTDEESSDKPKRKPNAADMWLEVWSDKQDQWVCIDLFRGEVDAVNSIRKSASPILAYVFAFQSDLSIKDVTARYCTNWAATLRKLRVDKSWLEMAISPYYGVRTERDKRENQELRRLHEEKPMPTAISEFKDHPLYALQRHLLKFQAIYPPNAPTLGFVRGEPVYSRFCVHTLHSREIWLKDARTVKLGEEPYKIVKARPKWDRLTQSVIKDQPLEIFGYWQTEEYDPPTAENGIVPRNAYGNVELFKECMLPKKTAHIRLPGLQRICKKLGIDCANAVIGFDFHQGACHPTFDGFVICEEFRDQVTAAWYQDQEEQDRKEQEKYEARVYGNWKKLIRGLLIRERLKKKYNM
ncbi:DNA repair protein complementing XP-C cells homolog [Teleopsis dalmanni]|uniref:DNA repair protein complementing XP-C cells homolog n=1 Tax=Teleopsis dalmanni TaxID=139649 RepID=UPI0018CCAAFB|nr:DNA repair protein complementing XP-C cells homolog [Teleopsis dalmanni]